MNVKDALEFANSHGMKLYISVTVDTNDADYLTELYEVELHEDVTVEMVQRFFEILSGSEMTNEEKEDEDFTEILSEYVPYFEGKDYDNPLECVRNCELYLKIS